MSKQQAIALEFEGEQLEGVFVGRRDNQARPTVMLIPTVMGVSDLEIGFGRQLVELRLEALEVSAVAEVGAVRPQQHTAQPAILVQVPQGAGQCLEVA